MGVNMVGFGITDYEVVKEASRQEIIRRYFKTSCDYKKGYCDKETADRAKLIMDELDLKESDRAAARQPSRQRLPLCLKSMIPPVLLISSF